MFLLILKILLILLILAFLPAAVVGLLFHRRIEANLFGPVPVLIALVTAVAWFARAISACFFSSCAAVSASRAPAAAVTACCACGTLRAWLGKMRQGAPFDLVVANISFRVLSTLAEQLAAVSRARGWAP